MNYLLTCLGLVLLLLVLARSFGARAIRSFVWIGALAAVFLMHFVAIDAPAFLRMVTICTVLMAGMKWIVYREWSKQKKRQLTWRRWWMFATLWFGMDPNAFIGVRRKCEWKSHALTGVSCVTVGGTLWWICYHYQVTNIVLLFIPMSMAFHFGALRLLTAFWRLCGFPVRTLFRNPLELRGFRDFWGNRWNLAYSTMMARAVKQPLVPVIGEKWSVFAVFLVSGLLHELAITLPVQAGYGLPTLFFIIHGIITMREKKNTRMNALACVILLIVGLPYLFNETFQNEVIIPSRDGFQYLINL